LDGTTVPVLGHFHQNFNRNQQKPPQTHSVFILEALQILVVSAALLQLSFDRFFQRWCSQHRLPYLIRSSSPDSTNTNANHSTTNTESITTPLLFILFAWFIGLLIPALLLGAYWLDQ
jgi:hypothetical protein